MREMKSIVLVACTCALFCEAVLAARKDKKVYPITDTKNVLVIADFDTWDDINNLGGPFSSWAKDPTDDTQICRVEITDEDFVGDKGHSIRMVYDVDSPRIAYNGMWMKLADSNWSAYRYLVLWLKGDKDAGFTPRFKIEIKNSKGENGAYVVTGIKDLWQQFVVPLKNFRGITRLTRMEELIFVFDDMRCNPKVGEIYVDSIYLSK